MTLRFKPESFKLILENRNLLLKNQINLIPIEKIIMKVVSSIGTLKNRNKDCQVVKRRGRTYVICKSDPRLKVRQGGAKSKRK